MTKSNIPSLLPLRNLYFANITSMPEMCSRSGEHWSQHVEALPVYVYTAIWNTRTFKIGLFFGKLCSWVQAKNLKQELSNRSDTSNRRYARKQNSKSAKNKIKTGTSQKPRTTAWKAYNGRELSWLGLWQQHCNSGNVGNSRADSNSRDHRPRR